MDLQEFYLEFNPTLNDLQEQIKELQENQANLTKKLKEEQKKNKVRRDEIEDLKS